MDRTTAENLLCGGDPLPPGHPLTALLAAAQAPATARELAGEAAATAAFRAAAHSPARPRRPRWAARLSRLLTLKVAAAAFATTATVGGVALAAGNGSLPSVGGGSEPVVTPSTAPRAARPVPEQPAPSASPAATATRSPRQIDQLCDEFSGRDRTGRERALDDKRFGELVRQAGRRDGDRVDRFCRELSPSRRGQPTWPGTASPSTRPDRPGAAGTTGWPAPPGSTGWPGSTGSTGRPGGSDDSGGPTRTDRPRPSASSSRSRR